MLFWAIFSICVIGALPFIARHFVRRHRRSKQPPSRVPLNATSPRPAPRPRPPVEMVTLGEVRRKYATRAAALHEDKSYLDKTKHLLDQVDFEGMDPESLIGHLENQDKENLAAILGLPASTPPVQFAMAIRRAGSHRVATLIRGQPIEYAVVARDVATKLGALDLPSKATIFELERRAISAVAQKMIDKATPAERQAILAEFSKGPKSSGGLAAAGGGMALAHLSGFGLYTAASTSLAAVSGAVGLTLPFAAYTGMSSAIATITGPIGWTVLVAAAAYKYFGPESKIAIAAVLCVAAGRARRIADLQADIEKWSDLVRAHELHIERLARLHRFLEQNAQFADGHSVAKLSVPFV